MRPYSLFPGGNVKYAKKAMHGGKKAVLVKPKMAFRKKNRKGAMK